MGTGDEIDGDTGAGATGALCCRFGTGGVPGADLGAPFVGSAAPGTYPEKNSRQFSSTEFGSAK